MAPAKKTYSCPDVDIYFYFIQSIEINMYKYRLIKKENIVIGEKYFLEKIEDSLRCVMWTYWVGRGDDNDEYSSSHFLSEDDKCDVSTNILTGKCLNQQENNEVKIIFIDLLLTHYFTIAFL